MKFGFKPTITQAHIGLELMKQGADVYFFNRVTHALEFGSERACHGLQIGAHGAYQTEYQFWA
ncbi:hypothetical protein GCM10011487_02700 [Steroidobacter agaridevorans]|uniref:Uncharacterized protein n=1 Tax=Steroidobacter agaridevorans TaxID=2695856 RepID=A0A829Y4Y3_9GAMM|nr:hypothetical protein GCM10011487_02700 [Steroidobacter agaridevorans]GFE89797.1 hypothetical protein GCM10011488_47510 [Steroidobacter agaridevorans]